jgi:hypothetical protein
MVECWPNRQEALGSILSTKKTSKQTNIFISIKIKIKHKKTDHLGNDYNSEIQKGDHI